VLKGQIIKIHGDPTINHHDWVIVRNGDKHYLCHILCFVDISEVDRAASFQVGRLDRPGLYGICHFVNQDVFTSAAPSNSMYGDDNYISYRTDENCSLIRGWAKFTKEINGPRIPCNMPNSCLAMFPVFKVSFQVALESKIAKIIFLVVTFSFPLNMNGQNYFISI